MDPTAVEIDGSVMEGVSSGSSAAVPALSMMLTEVSSGSESSVTDSLSSAGSGSFQGGQILRVSAALSCITGTSVKISKIRAGRSSPGLR